MKILSKITCAIAALGLVFAMSSCKKDKCYDCPAFTDANGTAYEAMELCKDTYGSTILLDLAVSSAELQGYDCND